MNEDEEIKGLVKAAMEADAAVGADTLRAIEAYAAQEANARRRRRRLWLGGASSLAAASVAVVLFFGNVAYRPADGMADVRNAIGLLCAADGIDEDLTAFPAGEMLLAWQDAPCADAL